MKNIKLARITHDLTQAAVRNDTGISQSTLSKYECGELMPTTANLITLAAYYKTSIDYLLDLTDDPRPYPEKKKED